jgi:hypothetical protein
MTPSSKLQNLTKAGKGRVKGTKNKATVVKEQLLACIDVQAKISDGTFVSPLGYLISVYSDTTVEVKTRIMAANLCLKYLHKPQPVEVNNTVSVGDNAAPSLTQLYKAIATEPKT